MKVILLVLMALYSLSLSAGDRIINAKKHKSVNYCHEKTQEKYLEALMVKYNYDHDVIKLYALRIGLCKAIDDGKIKLDDAIDVFNAEHLKIATEWAEEARKNEKKKMKTI